MKPEAILQRAILKAVSRGAHRWFANPRGKAICVPPGMMSAAVKALASLGIPAWVQSFGVGPDGAPDLLGIETVKLTWDDIGRTVALAEVAEIKTPRGRVAAHQTMFARTARRLGVRTFLWRSVEQAEAECR